MLTKFSIASQSTKRGVTLLMFYGIRSKVNQIVYTLILNCMPNVRILNDISRYRVDKVFYCYNANRIELKNEHNFAVLGPRVKKIRLCLLFVIMLCIKYQVSSISHSLVSEAPKSGNVQTAPPLQFVVCLSVCYFVLVFFSFFSIVITSLGEERANLSAFRAFVRFVLVWICQFPLPLGVWEGLRFVIVALPGLFSYLFFFRKSWGHKKRQARYSTP